MENTKLTIEQLNEIMEQLIADEDAENRETELLCGLALLAEAYQERKDYREVREQAQTALEVLPQFDVPVEMKLQVLKRIIRTVESTPYHHLLRNLLEAFVLLAHHSGEDVSSFRREAEKIVKLDVLLEPDPYNESNKELDNLLSSIFTSEEILTFIHQPDLGHLAVDRVEYTWDWESIALEVEERLDEILADDYKGMGFCHRYWSVKTELLRKEYGINWHSPAAMNPGVLFD